jgi:hypothetical protein
MSAAAGTLYLNKIREVAQVTEGKALTLMDACIWSFGYCGHPNGTSMKVVQKPSTSHYVVSWPENVVDDEELARSYNVDDAAEDGAEAIAFLLVPEITNFTAVERSTGGTGIDYWLGYKTNLNNPFEQAGRLEVSGLMVENEWNTVKKRISKKKTQTKQSDGAFSVYIIIVEFSEPYTTVVLKT